MPAVFQVASLRDRQQGARPVDHDAFAGRAPYAGPDDADVTTRAARLAELLCDGVIVRVVQRRLLHVAAAQVHEARVERGDELAHGDRCVEAQVRGSESARVMINRLADRGLQIARAIPGAELRRVEAAASGRRVQEGRHHDGRSGHADDPVAFGQHRTPLERDPHTIVREALEFHRGDRVSRRGDAIEDTDRREARRHQPVRPSADTHRLDGGLGHGQLPRQPSR